MQLKLNPLIPIHFFVIWLCKSQSVRKSIQPKTLTSWTQRDKTLQENVTFTEIKKIAWNYSNPVGTFEKLNKLKPSISRNEELYISKEAKTENALASEGKSFRPEKINMRFNTRPLSMKRPKFTFAQSKRSPPKLNLPDRKNNSLEKAAFLHEVKVVCCLPIPLFYKGEMTMTVGRCTQLEELFALTNI